MESCAVPVCQAGLLRQLAGLKKSALKATRMAASWTRQMAVPAARSAGAYVAEPSASPWMIELEVEASIGPV